MRGALILKLWSAWSSLLLFCWESLRSDTCPHWNFQICFERIRELRRVWEGSGKNFEKFQKRSQKSYTKISKEDLRCEDAPKVVCVWKCSLLKRLYFASWIFAFCVFASASRWRSISDLHRFSCLPSSHVRRFASKIFVFYRRICIKISYPQISDLHNIWTAQGGGGSFQPQWTFGL